MQIGKKGLELIKYFEGLRLQPYLDSVKIPTIGYGTIKYENGTSVTMKDPAITKERAEELLLHYIKKFEADVNKLVKVKLTQNQFDALVSFTYNLGPTNLRQSTLLAQVNESKFKDAANSFLKWINAGGKPIEGLKVRRRKEKELFEDAT